MTRVARAVTLTALCLAAVSAMAASRLECATVPSKYVPPAVRYCALLPASYPTSTNHSTKDAKLYPTLYFLHGLGQDAEELFSNGLWNLVDDLHQANKIKEFVVITPDAGRSFYINSKDARARYEDFFLREFIPAMERKYAISRSKEGRAIAGISMGGYGALRFAFEHPEMFAAVSVHSAALIEALPPGAGAAGLGGFVGTAFGRPLDTEYWRRESPFVFARKANLRGLKIYFDCGDHDSFGFENGAEELHRILKARNIPHEFHIYPGGHDWRYFSQHLPESLVFDSKALGK